MNPDINSIVEDAKRRGVDMSWLRAPGTGGQQAPVDPGGMGAVGRVSPGASDLMQAVQQAQAQSPVYIPFPGGTPTQARRQADESARQFEVGHEFDREQFDWRRDTDVRDFEANEAYRQAQLDLQQMRAAGGGAGGLPGEIGPRDATLTERDRIPASAAGRRMIEDIRNNPDIPLGQWIAAIQGEPQLRSALIAEGIDVNDFIRFIEEQYTLYHLLEAMSRVGKNVEPWNYGHDLQKRQDLIKQHNPFGKPEPEKSKKEKEEAPFELDFS